MKNYVVLYRDYLNYNGRRVHSIVKDANNASEVIIRDVSHLFTENGFYKEFEKFKQDMSNKTDREVMDYVNKTQDNYKYEGVYEQVL